MTFSFCLLLFVCAGQAVVSFEGSFLGNFSQGDLALEGLAFFLSHSFRFDTASITSSFVPLTVIPYPSYVLWPSVACASFSLSAPVTGLTNLSALLPGVSQRLSTRLAALAGVTAVSRSSSAKPLDGVMRTLNFALVSWTRTITVPQYGDDESYSLSLQTRLSFVDIRITASTSTGVVRALATLIQLLSDSTRCVPVGITIRDSPAFGWRGVGIDVARRFHSPDALMRICDGLEFARMNVLHLHLTDDQGWRFESLKWTNLHKFNYDGRYYSQAFLKSLVSYCALGGVRVVPEIETLGHISAALYAYPSLAPYHFPTRPVTDWGAFDYVLDVTQPTAVQFLNDILREVASVFPDVYLHVGGDEVIWPQQSSFQLTWMSSRGLTSSSMQRYVQSTLLFPILASMGRRGMGWDEMFAATGDGGVSLPAGFAVQWWRSVSLEQRVMSVVATGFYLDSLPNATELYHSPFLRIGDAGAEATLWSEGIGDYVESRIFPTLLAFAEVLWRGVGKNLADDSMLYRTYAQSFDGLGIFGVKHREVYETQVRGLTSGTLQWTLNSLVKKYSQDTLLMDVLLPSALYLGPLSDSVYDIQDAARPESASNQMLIWLAQIASSVEKFDPTQPATTMLTTWLTSIANMNATAWGAGLNSTTQDVKAIAGMYVAWIKAVQFSTNGSTVRKQALAAGYDYYLGIVVQSKFVMNIFKSSFGTALLAKDVGPFGYARSGGAQTTGSVATTQNPSVVTVQPVVVQSGSDWQVIVGAVVGSLGFAALVGAAVLMFVVYRRRIEKPEAREIEEEAIGVRIEGAVFLDESYVDYLDDDEESGYSAIGSGREGLRKSGLDATTTESTSLSGTPVVMRVEMTERTEAVSSTDDSSSELNEFLF